jgi:FMNH2-dependent dimethyl sulfone monooxygenase
MVDKIAGSRPLSDNRLKLGVFAFNGTSTIRTLAPERFQFNWPNSLDVAEQADRLGFEAIVPNARFSAMVNPTHYSGEIYECFTWAAALAARTRTSHIMSTVHVTNVHPVLAAKAMTTIDHVSNGRFGLNIVTGWSKKESEMFGLDLLPLEHRYAYADEWITAVKRLWTEDDEFDFDGRFIKFKGGMSLPKPIQKPYPILMNAGASEEGENFAARHCDMAFINTTNFRDRGRLEPGRTYTEFDKMKIQVDGYRELARQRYGKELQIWVNCSVVLGDTERHAHELVDHYFKHADLEHIGAHLDRRHRDLPPEQQAALTRRFACGGNGHLLLGDAEQIAIEMTKMSAAGIDGLLLTWVDYQNGIRQFGNKVMPLLEEAGVRHKLRQTAMVAE